MAEWYLRFSPNFKLAIGGGYAYDSLQCACEMPIFYVVQYPTGLLPGVWLNETGKQKGETQSQMH